MIIAILLLKRFRKAPTFMDLIHRLMLCSSEYVSIHGINWYKYLNPGIFRQILAIVSTVLSISLPFVLVFTVIRMMNEREANQRMITKENETITFPHVIICHSGIFNKHRIQKSISKFYETFS